MKISSTTEKPVRAKLCLYRLPFMLIVAFFMLSVTTVKARYQDDKFTIRLNKVKLEQVFKAVEQQSGYRFFYSAKLMADALPVSIDVKGVTITDVLAEAFKNQPLRYEIDQKSVLVRPKADLPAKTNPDTNPRGRDTLIDVSGRVVSAKDGTPLPGATVKLSGSSTGVTTDADGRFKISVSFNDKLSVSYVGFNLKEVRPPWEKNGGLLLVALEESQSTITAVEVVSTGYQLVPKERATGSFVQVDNKLLNRRVSTNIIDRLEGVTSGLIFNSNIQQGENESPYSIRGRSTLFANTQPLIVIDNFPYEGDINNINPNDVLTITVLKDAAAASIWGARSGNGVIVITTKSGKINAPLTVNLTSNTTIGGKPNLYYHPQMKGDDYIEIEKFLFNQGFFDGAINATPRSQLSPAIDVLLNLRKLEITEAEASEQLKALGQYDIRDDLTKYFQQNSINQQYSINLTGGGKKSAFYLSGGYDHNRAAQVGNNFSRVSITGKNIVYLLADKMEISTNVAFSSSTTTNNAVSIYEYYPYARLVGENREALALYNKSGLNKTYVDTAGQGMLLDWTYRPLNELTASDNKTTLNDYRINIAIKYELIKNLSVNLVYQYNIGLREVKQLQSEGSFAARDLINQYTQLDYTTHMITKMPYPAGSIFTRLSDEYSAHNLRGQLSYVKNWYDKHSISVISGAEITDYNSEQNSNTLYGYDSRNATSVPVIGGTYIVNPFGYEAVVNSPTGSRKFGTNRYISYYTNATYAFMERYQISASARKDESNIFGVNANQRGVPLWSVGAGWDISKENFYKFTALPYLKLRYTYGYNGNIDKSVSAYTTARPEAIITNRYGAIQYSIVNPPNPNLRWEKISVTNIGLDFKTKGDILTGSLEGYKKIGIDLIGNSPVAASSGLTLFKGNNSNIETRGIDLILNTHNVSGKFNWTSNFLASYTSDKVIKYLPKPGTLSNYIQQDFSYPYEGRPYNSIFALDFAGLDHETGAPRGYLKGEISTDYSALRGISDPNDMIYMGPGRPNFYGSFRNNIEYEGFTFSINISYKFRYYYKKLPTRYDLLSKTFGGSATQPDFEKRWQNPGDEKTTNIPSYYYPLNVNRELFYKDTKVMVEKGDHVRVQDVRIGYNLLRVLPKKTFKGAEVFAYINNIGLLWKATDDYTDPDYLYRSSIYDVPAPLSITLGATLNF